MNLFTLATSFVSVLYDHEQIILPVLFTVLNSLLFTSQVAIVFIGHVKTKVIEIQSLKTCQNNFVGTYT